MPPPKKWGLIRGFLRDTSNPFQKALFPKKWRITLRFPWFEIPILLIRPSGNSSPSWLLKNWHLNESKVRQKCTERCKVFWNHYPGIQRICCIPTEWSHIPPKEKEHHRLKSVLGRGMWSFSGGLEFPKHTPNKAHPFKCCFLYTCFFKNWLAIMRHLGRDRDILL